MDKLGVLRQYFGHSSFRHGQEELIDNILSGRDVLGVLPTGAGKSICYQIPAIISGGITIVISPLISLMQDQVLALNQAGVPAAYINSSLSYGQCMEALRRASNMVYKIIYVAPERIKTKSFRNFIEKVPISLVAVDEAHCVSQWGKDFRKSYLDIADFVSAISPRPTLAAFTATATKHVKEDILKLLSLKDPFVLSTGFDRPNLYFEVRHEKNKDDTLLRIIQKWQGKSGIVYCSTRKNVNKVCDFLRKNGISAVRYHAGLSDEKRKQAQDDFQFDRADVMVATNAFGMGIDKSNVYFVVHYNMPMDIESYYQEAGRAGRDGEKADCILLYSKQDVIIAKYILSKGNDRAELDPEERILLEQQDAERLKHMVFYSTTKKCLRSFLLTYFGEYSLEDCGNCSSCIGKGKLPKFSPKTYAVSSGNELVFAALRTIRNKIALNKKLPAYIIFQDSSLRDMADKMPKTMQEFESVSGVGDKRKEQYGEIFIELIKVLDTALNEGKLNSLQEAQDIARDVFDSHKT